MYMQLHMKNFENREVGKVEGIDLRNMQLFFLSECPDEEIAWKKVDELVKKCFPEGTEYLVLLEKILH